MDPIKEAMIRAEDRDGIFVCENCEANYQTEETLPECPVCGWHRYPRADAEPVTQAGTRAAGNAINKACAVRFIEAASECI